MYGDGVFRTLHVRDGRPLWWEAQLAKLAADARRLGISPPAPEVWAGDAACLLAHAPAECVLKLVLTRGPATRGYRPPVDLVPTRIALVYDWPQHLGKVAVRGARLHLCRLRLAEQPCLAGIKHLNRLENVLAGMEWTDPDIDEGLLLDASGRVVGGVSSNLFLYRHGRLLTPRIDRCGVAGVARARLMAVAGELKLEVVETDIRLDELLEADEVMLTNSLIKLWRVASLGDRTWEGSRVSLALRARMDA